MNLNELTAIAQFIGENDDFAIVCHENPDGDSLGSLLALRLGLNQLKKRVQSACIDPVPYKYRLIAGSEMLVTLKDLKPFSHLICVDCADLARTGFTDEMISNVPSIINIDHHKSNEGFGQLNLMSADISATGILVYALLKELGVDITPMIAHNLFIAISADTGHFMHANTNENCLKVASELVGYGANPNLIAREIFQTTTSAWVSLLGKAIASLEFHCEGRAALMCLTREDYESAHAEASETEGIVDYAKNIDTVEVAALLRDAGDGVVKVSLRSKDYVDVGKIASVFTGGGHMLAAGYSIESSLEEAKQTLVTVLEGLQC